MLRLKKEIFEGKKWYRYLSIKQESTSFPTCIDKTPKILKQWLVRFLVYNYQYVYGFIDVIIKIHGS